MAKGKKTMKRKSKKTQRAKRIEPFQNLCNTGPLGALGAGDGISYYVNAAHILSMMNRKAFHQVTKSGHLKNYGLQLQVFNMTNGSTTVKTAPTSYPTYRAVRAWHFARKERYEKAGYSLKDLGYGERLRFALDSTHAALNQSTSGSMIGPQGFADTVAVKGEWDWSDVIITPPVLNVNYSLEADDAFDTFTLHLCGDHVVDTGTGGETVKFARVGIVQSWLENRRGWSAPDAEEAIQPENPLAYARMSELSSREIVEEVIDESQQSPPYSNEDDDDEASIFASLVNQGNLETAFPNPTTNSDMIVAPGGLAKIQITNNHDSAAFPFISLRIVELD